MRRLLLTLPLAVSLFSACPDGPGEGEGEGGEGEGEGEGGDVFAVAGSVDIDADFLVSPGFAITARSDGRFAVAWFEEIADVVQCDLFGGGLVDGPVYRLMLGDEQADGSVAVRVVDDFVPNTKEQAVDLAVDGSDRVLVAYMGGEVTRTFCGASDLMLAVENGDGFDIQSVAEVSDTGVVCRGTAGGDPYCNEGEVVGLYPSIDVDGDDVAIGFLDTHFGFGNDDITQTDLELARGTVAGGFTVTSVNMESGGGYYDGVNLIGDGRVLIGHNVTANNQFADEDGGSFVVDDGIYAEVVAADGSVVHSVNVLEGVFTVSRIATASFAGKGLFLAVHDRNSESLLLFRSLDDGASWTPSPIEQLGRSGRDPNLVFLDDGRLVAVYGHCRDDENQDGCSAGDDGVRFALFNEGNAKFGDKLTAPGDAEDLEAIGVDAAKSGPSQIVAVSLNASQNRLTVHRVQVN